MRWFCHISGFVLFSRACFLVFGWTWLKVLIHPDCLSEIKKKSTREWNKKKRRVFFSRCFAVNNGETNHVPFLSSSVGSSPREDSPNVACDSRCVGGVLFLFKGTQVTHTYTPQQQKPQTNTDEHPHTQTHDTHTRVNPFAISIFRSTDRSIHPSIDRSIDRSIQIFIYLSIYISIYLTIYISINN